MYCRMSRGQIVEALIGHLSAPPSRNRPANLEAYDLCVRARALIEISRDAAREATLLLERAIALDPGYAEAHQWLAYNLWTAWAHWGAPMEPNMKRVQESIRLAIANSTFSFIAAMLNEPGVPAAGPPTTRFVRPDRSVGGLVGFDPWDDLPTLTLPR